MGFVYAPGRGYIVVLPYNCQIKRWLSIARTRANASAKQFIWSDISKKVKLEDEREGLHLVMAVSLNPTAVVRL